MAQIVGYTDGNITFEEGPFVICRLPFGGYRIEQQQGTESGALDMEILRFWIFM